MVVAVETRPARENQAISQFRDKLSGIFDDVTIGWEGRARLARAGCRDACHLLPDEGWVATAVHLALPQDVNDRIAVLAGHTDIRYGDNALVALSTYRRHPTAARTALGVDWRNCAPPDSILFHHPHLTDKLDRLGNLFSIPRPKKGIDQGFLREDADAQLKDFLGKALTADIPRINRTIEHVGKFGHKDTRESLLIGDLTPEERKVLERVEGGLVSGDEQEEFKAAVHHGPVHNKDAAPPVTEDDLVSRLASLAGLPEKAATSRKYIARPGRPEVLTRKTNKDQDPMRKSKSSADEDERRKERRQARALLADAKTDAHSADFPPPSDSSESATSEEMRIWKKRQAQMTQPKMQPALKGDALKHAKKEAELLKRIKEFEIKNNAIKYGRS